MKKVIHRAEDRGFEDHGWLKTHHSFSFGSYFDPDRMHFGALRVLNDDRVAPGKGFGRHPHKDMEIVTIPLEGTIEHRDSAGHGGVLRPGQVQAMTAGTGIEHSEFNHNDDRELAFLQIWVIPRHRKLEPRYQEQAVPRGSGWRQIVSPDRKDDGLWIQQDAWFYLREFDAEEFVEYSVHGEGQGVYLFLLEGRLKVDDMPLGKRDAIGIWDTEKISILAEENARILLIEVPMELN